MFQRVVVFDKVWAVVVRMDGEQRMGNAFRGKPKKTVNTAGMTTLAAVGCILRGDPEVPSAAGVKFPRGATDSMVFT